MSILIQLSHCNYTVALPREGLMAMRGSLFAQALEIDPNETEIKLENPGIKPYHMDVISLMARQGNLEFKKEMYMEFTTAAEYLNWSLLEAVADPNYALMQVYAPYANIYKPETYGPILLWSIRNNFTSLARHILQVTETGPLDGQALTLSVMMDNVDIVRRLLQRGVDPVTNYTPKYILDMWYPLEEFVHSLFGGYSPYWVQLNVGATKNQTFYLACVVVHGTSPKVLQCLVQDERIRQAISLRYFVIETSNLPACLAVITSTDSVVTLTQREALHLLLKFVTLYNNRDVYTVAQNPYLNIPEALRKELLPQNDFTGEQLTALIKSFFK